MAKIELNIGKTAVNNFTTDEVVSILYSFIESANFALKNGTEMQHWGEIARAYSNIAMAYSIIKELDKKLSGDNKTNML